jgi:hypothetical protein
MYFNILVQMFFIFALSVQLAGRDLLMQRFHVVSANAGTGESH